MLDTHNLSQFKEKLLIMASHAEGMVTRAIRAHLDRDEPAAKQALETDEVIDQLEIQIDRIALRLLADNIDDFKLRQITCGMKIAQDLERVGDEASTIARRSILLMCLPNLNTSTDITEMTFLVNAMLKDALDAFVTGNTVLARGVIPRDKKVDDLNKLYQEDLIDIMKLSSDNISQCLHLGVIIKSLERIGDHAKNVAEDAVLLHEGKDIRHNSTDN
ncbi:MAG: phosphate transport system regulatory protein PhoU [Opitutia bacterium TMED67]|nr:phosphate transport system regulatory protein PhoU [Verrucomicrobiales bacterium]MAZ11560.1 phosphate transport system regulatory protein PhoU [Verrucomicrobiales bacterium]OUU70153.1 MAG: phosphate transport system regulatory protein PhoU [Opitutae bacterium TMED67]RZO55414.1 MAG: phosphate signaling complex protein PhoU [Limisphaerales bacterium]|tara:strand:- start:786 stop:1439 length:654 start_codon:yes stop_codon:yes gene_type:complete